MTLAAEVRAAYDASGTAWGQGPTSLYTELARPLLAACGEVSGARVLDVGTGGGAVASLLAAHGADVVACDGSFGMLAPGAAARPPAAVADVLALPFRDRAVDVCVAGFVLNHLPDPSAAAREMARVGGRVVATTFGGNAAAEVKEHLDQVASQRGWVAPDWYVDLHTGPLYQPAPAAAAAALDRAGLVDISVEVVTVSLALTVEQVLAWRWGMAHYAPFIASLSDAQRAELDDDARAGLEPLGPLDFPVLVMAGQARD